MGAEQHVQRRFDRRNALAILSLSAVAPFVVFGSAPEVRRTTSRTLLRQTAPLTAELYSIGPPQLFSLPGRPEERLRQLSSPTGRSSWTRLFWDIHQWELSRRDFFPPRTLYGHSVTLNYLSPTDPAAEQSALQQAQEQADAFAALVITHLPDSLPPQAFHPPPVVSPVHLPSHELLGIYVTPLLEHIRTPTKKNK
jgi:hypothetical protein